MRFSGVDASPVARLLPVDASLIRRRRARSPPRVGRPGRRYRTWPAHARARYVYDKTNETVRELLTELLSDHDPSHFYSLLLLLSPLVYFANDVIRV
jgi:hypothetical protein